MLTRRLTRLITLVYGLPCQPTQELTGIVRDKRYPPLLRKAALRCLVHSSPLSVTKGASFAERRRCARRFYAHRANIRPETANGRGISGPGTKP
jgi:hypothetical protein